MDDEELEAVKLGERLRRDAQYHAAPPRLAARILAALPEESAADTPKRRPRWNLWWAAPAFAGACALFLAVGLYLGGFGADDPFADEVIAAHVRSLMVDHASDVASSDRHTVKPWFAGKLDYAPPVVDLTAQGFALVGGRLDYLERRPVAALVYRHRQHLINLFVSPAKGNESPRTISRQGFHLLRWTSRGMNFRAVSDLNPEDLANFKAMLEKAAE